MHISSSLIRYLARFSLIVGLTGPCFSQLNFAVYLHKLSGNQLIISGDDDAHQLSNRKYGETACWLVTDTQIYSIALHTTGRQKNYSWTLAFSDTAPLRTLRASKTSAYEYWASERGWLLGRSMRDVDSETSVSLGVWAPKLMSGNARWTGIRTFEYAPVPKPGWEECFMGTQTATLHLGLTRIVNRQSAYPEGTVLGVDAAFALLKVQLQKLGYRPSENPNGELYKPVDYFQYLNLKYKTAYLARSSKSVSEFWNRNASAAVSDEDPPLPHEFVRTDRRSHSVALVVRDYARLASNAPYGSYTYNSELRIELGTLGGHKTFRFASDWESIGSLRRLAVAGSRYPVEFQREFDGYRVGACRWIALPKTGELQLLPPLITEHWNWFPSGYFNSSDTSFGPLISETRSLKLHVELTDLINNPTPLPGSKLTPGAPGYVEEQVGRYLLRKGYYPYPE